MEDQEAKKVEINPNVKKGDFIIVIKARNGNNNILHKVVEVIKGSTMRGGNIVVKYINKQGILTQMTLYRDGNPSDEYVLATKDNIIQSLEDAKQPYLEKIAELDKLIEFHKKYENEEEFAADKIDTLINAAQNGKSKKERVKLMAEVLRELKATNYL
jgi:hypothetical protein